MTGTIKPHRNRNPHRCVRCANSHRYVPAEWIITRDGLAAEYMCDAHATYWAAVYGITKEKKE